MRFNLGFLDILYMSITYQDYYSPSDAASSAFAVVAEA